MITISKNDVYSRISDSVDKDFDGEVRKAENYLRARSTEADKARARLQSHRDRKTEIEAEIQTQLGIQAGCQNRRKTYQERVFENQRRQIDCDATLADAQYRARSAAEQQLYARRRADELEMSVPVDTSNHDREMEEYRRRQSVMKAEIDSLAKKHREAVREARRDEEFVSIANHLQLELDKLMRQQRLDVAPVENDAFKQQQQKHEMLLEEARSASAAASAALRDAEEAVDHARQAAAATREEAESLASEPERDKASENHAMQRELELREEMASLQLDWTPGEEKIVWREIDAQSGLNAVLMDRFDAAEACRRRFDEAEVSRSGQLQDLEVLTGHRKEAESLWEKARNSEVARITAEAAPNLENVEKELATARFQRDEQRNRLRERFGTLALTEEENEILTGTFSEEDRHVLESGGELTYRPELSFSDHFFNIFFGGLAGLCAFAGIIEWFQIEEPEQGWQLLLSGVSLIVLCIIGIGIVELVTEALRGERKVWIEKDDNGLPQLRDTGLKYRSYERALRHQGEYAVLEGLKKKVAGLEAEVATLSSIAEEKVNTTLPATADKSPLDTHPELDSMVEHWNSQLLAASRGHGPWPEIDPSKLKARRADSSPGYSAVWNRWRDELREEKLEAFLP